DLLSAKPSNVLMPEQIDSFQKTAVPISTLLEAWLPTNYAGVFLLLRACLDLRLPALIKEAGWPDSASNTSLSMLLAALGKRLAGKRDDEFDPGLALWSGSDSLPTDLSTAWPGSTLADEMRWQTSLLRTLAVLRFVQRDHLLLYETNLNGHAALIGADAGGILWPYGCIIDSERSVEEIAGNWQATWSEATGEKPELITAETAARHEKWRLKYEYGAAACQSTFAALERGRLGRPQQDLTVALLGAALLRVWSRWLRQFDTSSPTYLIRQFIRRPGFIRLSAGVLQVQLAPRPLDMILEMAGYLEPLENLSWLPYRQVTFHSGGGAFQGHYQE
ncbi:MAG: hypothetical protein R3293_26310, partial [Candidatus Promineifilaceae bacterium]|nr:hypothetical protein [Candidatus Promineifilaceae bacterium]